jgi:hypothetical protein
MDRINEMNWMGRIDDMDAREAGSRLSSSMPHPVPFILLSNRASAAGR